MSQSGNRRRRPPVEEAARKGDLDRLASLYTPDAMALPPDSALVQGRRKNIKHMWGNIAQQIGLKDMHLDTSNLQLVGDTAYEGGEASLTLASGSAVVKFVVVWKRNGGQWRLHRDIWNVNSN